MTDPIQCLECGHDIDHHRFDFGFEIDWRCGGEDGFTSGCPCRRPPSEIARALLAAEPTEDEVEAAAQTLYERDPEAGYTWPQVPWADFLLADARAALRAARGLA